MNCTNCGAPMDLFAERRYYFCHHYGSSHFLQNPAVDGVQVLVGVAVWGARKGRPDGRAQGPPLR